MRYLLPLVCVFAFFGCQTTTLEPLEPGLEQISFSIPTDGHVILYVQNSYNTPVKFLIDGNLTAGQYTVSWDLTDNRGEIVLEGLYFWVLKSDAFTIERELLLVNS